MSLRAGLKSGFWGSVTVPLGSNRAQLGLSRSDIKLRMEFGCSHSGTCERTNAGETLNWRGRLNRQG